MYTERIELKDQQYLGLGIYPGQYDQANMIRQNPRAMAVWFRMFDRLGLFRSNRVYAKRRDVLCTLNLHVTITRSLYMINSCYVDFEGCTSAFPILVGMRLRNGYRREWPDKSRKWRFGSLAAWWL